MYSKEAGILFLINPISMILTGSHSQFDNIAIFFGLLGWCYYLNNKKGWSYVIFGISMLFKHILLFFPLWLMIFELYKKASLRKKITEIVKICSIYYIFIAGFIFELLRSLDNRDVMINSIIKNVILYRGYGTSIGTTITNFVVPKTVFDLTLNFPIFKGYMLFYMIFVFLVGLLFVRRKIDLKYAYPLYTAVFFALSFSIARQYFAIPLIAVYIFYDKIESMVFTFVGYIYIATTAFENTANYIKIDYLLSIFDYKIYLYPWVHHIVITYANAQIWILILALSVLVTASHVISKNQKKILIRMYTLIFTLFYISLSLYVFSRKIKADQKLPLIIVNTETAVEFTCSSRLKTAYPIYKINKTLTLDKTLVTNFTTCTQQMPLF